MIAEPIQHLHDFLKQLDRVWPWRRLLRNWRGMENGERFEVIRPLRPLAALVPFFPASSQVIWDLTPRLSLQPGFLRSCLESSSPFSESCGSQTYLYRTLPFFSLPHQPDHPPNFGSIYGGSVSVYVYVCVRLSLYVCSSTC